MTGWYTKEDSEYFAIPENKMMYEFNLIFTSNAKIFDRTPEMAKEKDKVLKKFFKKWADKLSNSGCADG
jgi:hypothetical protein